VINNKPGLGQIPQNESQAMQSFLGAVKEHVEVAQGVRGTYKDRYVTLDMLVTAGILTDAQARQLGSN
jgi:hypothetical protein